MANATHSRGISVHRRARTLPPVAPLGPTVGPEDGDILAELPTKLGGVLWRSLRSVRLWAGAIPAERVGLFNEGAYEARLAELLSVEGPERLVADLSGLATVLAGSAWVQPAVIAGHCAGVAAWARTESLRHITLCALRAAAECCPWDPALALHAGMEARDQVLYPEAESWLQRAVVLGRQAGHWEIYTRAHLAMATMWLRRGALPTARRHLDRAEHRAGRAGLREFQGRALHDRFVLEFSAGGEALHLAQRALACYPAGSPRLIALAFDLSVYWMDRGNFEGALATSRVLLPRVQPEHRPNLYGVIARSAGACGVTSEYRRAVRALGDLPGAPGTASAWLCAAHGAVNLGLWEEARTHAQRGLECALARREQKVRFEAEGFLEMIEQKSRPAPPPELEEPAADAFTAELLATIEALPVFSGA
ncbi:MAG TPA: hypothetical protein VFL93_03050 [Longimicrobiaceae bacterium]|nr:hypothetical protein [Longimicrobiaceae bacterium]